jgi:hypothetical protein
MKEKPLSENIAHYAAGDYHVTAAIWRGHMGTSYEIGIRKLKAPGKFHLFQGDWDHQSVQEVANAIATLLAQDYTPEWCMEHFK